MALKFIKKHFHPEELISIPFLLLFIIIHIVYKTSINLRPAFLYWIVVVTVFLLSVFIFIKWFKIFYAMISNKVSADWFGWQDALFFRYLFSIGIILSVYDNLHDILPLISSPDKDKYLYLIDSMVFRHVHPTVFMQKFISAELTDWMSFCYLTFFFYIPVLLFVFFFSKLINPLRILLLAVSITVFVGFIGYWLVPAVGPSYFLANHYSVDLGGRAISNFTSQTISALSATRDVFPSLHIALSSVYLLVTIKYHRILFFIFLPFILFLQISTVYLRYHYIIDILAGYVLAVLAVWVSEKICAWWYSPRVSLPL